MVSERSNSDWNDSPDSVELDYARLMERNGQLLPDHFVWFANFNENSLEPMINSITQPLQWQTGIEEFRDVINDAELQIRGGLLRNPWEVEVTLVLTGKVRSRGTKYPKTY